ncbi:MAG: recombinase family protein [Oscillospiraceae bacterium]|nr:recombinase family protein [Oscillospiraceae bacterium]
MAKQKRYKVGIYVRLSKEDDRAGESVSIENQKLMLEKYAEEKGWNVYEIYQDDGFSGTNQNRPAFQKMIVDVKDGIINTILIKDLSRLGRNYLEVGNLAEIFLPEHGCELISLNEKLDDMMVFRNWFNEQHSKTTSTKVKAAKRISASSGKFTGTYAPYGYQKDPNNRHQLVVDENTAPVVRRIFSMRAAGTGFRAIAMHLNDDGISTPREVYYKNKGEKNPTKTSRLWGQTTVQDIAKNEVYIGNLVACKYGTLSYKNQKQVRKDRDEWVRVEGTHEPLVDLDLWERVQEFTHKKYRPSRRTDGGTNLFTGLLYCSDCDFKHRGNVERRKRKDGSEYKHVSYMCSTYGRSGKAACTIHSIGENVLMDLVVAHLQGYAERIEFNEERMLSAILAGQTNNNYSSVYLSELDAHLKQLDKLDTLIESLYEDKISGLVPDSFFKRQVQKYEQERVERSKSVAILEHRVSRIKPLENGAEKWMSMVREYARLETLDPEMLNLLIDRIIVGETQIINGSRECDIRIVYNYVGDIDRLSLLPPQAVNA